MQQSNLECFNAVMEKIFYVNEVTQSVPKRMSEINLYILKGSSVYCLTDHSLQENFYFFHYFKVMILFQLLCMVVIFTLVYNCILSLYKILYYQSHS